MSAGNKSTAARNSISNNSKSKYVKGGSMSINNKPVPGAKNGTAARDSSIAPDICSICNLADSTLNRGKKKDKWLECTFCEEWFHIVCCNVSEIDYNVYESTNKSYFCDTCSDLKTKHVKLKTNPVSDSSTPSEDLASRAQDYFNIIQPQLEVLIKNIFAGFMQEVVGKVKRDVDMLVEKNTLLEKRVFELEANVRSKNIILRGCPDNWSISPKEVVKRIADLIDFQLDTHNLLFAKKMFYPDSKMGQLRQNDRADERCSHILVVFSCMDVKVSFLKKYLNYTKSKPIRVRDLIQNNQNDLDKLADYVNKFIFIGDHLDRQTFVCSLRVKKLHKEGIVNKFMLRGGCLWVKLRKEDDFSLIGSLADLETLLQNNKIGILESLLHSNTIGNHSGVGSSTFNNLSAGGQTVVGGV